MADPWWLVSTSSENGKPWNVELGQGTAAQAKAADSAGLTVSGWPMGPYASSAAASAAAAKAKIPVGGTVQLGTSPLNPQPKSVGIPGVGSVSLTGLDAIGAFFGNLTDANTWVRVGEVVLGLILLAVGTARITHAQNFISTAVKAAAV